MNISHPSPWVFVAGRGSCVRGLFVFTLVGELRNWPPKLREVSGVLTTSTTGLDFTAKPLESCVDRCSFVFVSEAVLSLPLSFFTLRPRTNAQRTERGREGERQSRFTRPLFHSSPVLSSSAIQFYCDFTYGSGLCVSEHHCCVSEVLSYLLLTLGAAHHSTVAELTASTAQHRR